MALRRADLEMVASLKDLMVEVPDGKLVQDLRGEDAQLFLDFIFNLAHTLLHVYHSVLIWTERYAFGMSYKSLCEDRFDERYLLVS